MLMDDLWTGVGEWAPQWIVSADDIEQMGETHEELGAQQEGHKQALQPNGPATKESWGIY